MNKNFNLVPIWTPLYWHRKLLAEKVSRLTEVLCVGNRHLDLGCGDQPYRSYFEKRGISYVGADVETHDKDIVRIDPVRETVLAPDGSFDSISHFQVLEHVPNFMSFLSECQRLLKQDGIMIATVPFAFEFHAVPSDYRRWTHEGLRHDLEHFGFRIVDIGPIESDWVSLMTMNQLHLANLFGLVWPKPVYLFLNLVIFLLRGGPHRIPLTNWVVCQKCS
jgi:SAM-dependent methyltransferase